MKIKIFSSLLFSSLLILNISCKEMVDGNVSSGNYSSLLSVMGPTCKDDMQGQLAWMARGIAKVSADLTIRASIESEMANSDNFEVSNAKAQTKLQNSNAYMYDLNVADAINNHFPNNDYDDSYFFSFTCDSCDYATGLYSPNFDFPSISKLGRVYVVPISEDFDGDSMYGYFYNTTTSSIDSAWIVDGEFDSAYVWIISAYNSCEGEVFEESQTEGYRTKRGPCNFNDSCDSYWGETISNCPDCGENTSNYSLYILEYELLTDNKKGSVSPSINYQEGWARKYKISLQYLIFRNQNRFSGNPDYRLITSYKFVENTADNANLNDRADWAIFYLDKVKSRGKDAEVKRCNLSNSNCNPHKRKVFEEDILLCQTYMPNDIVDYVIYEKDRSNPQLYTTGESIRIGGADYMEREISILSKEYPYTKSNLGIASRLNSNTQWQFEPSSGFYTYETTLDGEMRVKFGYKSNY